MAREVNSLYSLNRGVIDRRALAHVDAKRVALAAETQENFISRVLGYMSLRPGFKYLGATASNNVPRYLPFVFSTTDTALLEFTASVLRIWIGDQLLTRPSVSTAVTNGTFAGSLAGWTDNDEAGATSQWIAANYMELVGSGSAYAIRDQTVSVSAADAGVEHAVRIVVARGPVMVRIGSTSGGDEYVRETTIDTGTHSLSFTPTGNFYVRFKSRLERKVWVQSCAVESAGVVTLPSPYPTAALPYIRHEQSGDTVYLACDGGYQQRKVERRGTRPSARSWSISLFRSEDGPFKVENVTPTTITPSALTGNITLTASAPLFRSTHVGALFSVTSVGQSVSATGAANGVPTSSIRVTGISNERTFSIDVVGNTAGSTVNLQRSYDNSTWVTLTDPSVVWTAPVSTSLTDGLDNQIVYYRLILTTRVAPDSVTMTLRIGSGSVRGVVRITDYTSSASVGAEVLSSLGGTDATDVWQEGQWSDVAGWPTAVRLHEGRLWWSGQNGVWGSVSDAFTSHDETVVGDSGPIARTIGSGPVDSINWLLSLKGLVIGAQGAEYTARASSLDEVLTPSAFNLKGSSTQGSGFTDAIKADQVAYFVNRSGVKVFRLQFDLRAYDYSADDMTKVCPEIGVPGIVRLAAQRLPDTRIHCVRSDGTVALCVIDMAEEVVCWQTISTDGLIKDAVVLPSETGNADDQVYYAVQRTINGATVCFLEKWAQESECRGGDLNMQADAFVSYSGLTTSTVSAPHLANAEVVIWADGLDEGTDDSAATWTQRYTLNGSGNATISRSVTKYVVGLPYEAQFKSGKLGTPGQLMSPLNQQKRIHHIGFILHDFHPLALRYGPSFDYLDNQPEIERGTSVGSAVQADYDENLIEFPGEWTTDARICLVAQAPRPVTIAAVTFDLQRNT